MDIGKYIGRFLLKNKYCSLPGLGVFDLKKEAARQNASNDTMSPPSYKITFTPVGSIDDTFASFIASAENVSISNASNNIRDYCKAVKDELSKTGKFTIENLGYFTMSGQVMVFHQSAELDMGLEPLPLPPLTDKTKSPEALAAKADYSYPPARQQKPFPIGKVLILVFTVGILAIGMYFGYHFYEGKQDDQDMEEGMTVTDNLIADTMNTVIDSTIVTNADSTTAIIDSAAVNSDTASSRQPPTAPAAIPSSGYAVAVLSYSNEGSAQTKALQLKKYGNETSVVNRDGRFIVVIQALKPVSDTASLVDSLRRFYNPKGPVYILK